MDINNPGSTNPADQSFGTGNPVNVSPANQAPGAGLAIQRGTPNTNPSNLAPGRGNSVQSNNPGLIDPSFNIYGNGVVANQPCPGPLPHQSTSSVTPGPPGKGATGPSGGPGPTGPSGGPGPTGASGGPGPTGASGPSGDPGPTGASGPSGDPGPTGATGPSGDPGPTGASGPSGGPGPTGATGPSNAISLAQAGYIPILIEEYTVTAPNGVGNHLFVFDSADYRELELTISCPSLVSGTLSLTADGTTAFFRGITWNDTASPGTAVVSTSGDSVPLISSAANAYEVRVHLRWCGDDTLALGWHYEAYNYNDRVAQHFGRIMNWSGFLEVLATSAAIPVGSLLRLTGMRR